MRGAGCCPVKCTSSLILVSNPPRGSDRQRIEHNSYTSADSNIGSERRKSNGTYPQGAGERPRSAEKYPSSDPLDAQPGDSSATDDIDSLAIEAKALQVGQDGRPPPCRGMPRSETPKSDGGGRRMLC
jgi:hypothetical protein